MILRAALLTSLAPALLAAQEIERFARAVPSMTSEPPAVRPSVTSVASVPSWSRPLMSLVIPGTGQLAGQQPRGLVYLALEAWLLSRAIAAGHRGRVEQAQYRALAYDVARRAFSATRVDGPFDYYETMEKYVESGVFNLNPGGALVPEIDTTTFNGFVWLLARRTFFANPDSAPAPNSPAWINAITFYSGRAVGPDFRWSWRGARLEQDVFRGAIRSSDEAYRERTNLMGALVLNHLASAIDALISVRMGRRPLAVPQVRFEIDPGSVMLLWTGSF